MRNRERNHRCFLNYQTIKLLTFGMYLIEKLDLTAWNKHDSSNDTTRFLKANRKKQSKTVQPGKVDSTSKFY